MSSAKQVYEWLGILLRRASMVQSKERRAYLELAQYALSHPALAPFRLDPLRSLEGTFLSLDVQAQVVEQILASCPDEKGVIGGCWGALYVPGQKQARACRIWAAVDWSQKGAWSWPQPTPVLPVAPDVMVSAQTALVAALAVIEDSTLCCPWLCPAPLYFVVEGAEEASGESLTLPLMLAFLSALTRLPLHGDLGATGTIHEGAVGEVGWLRQKREALLAQGVTLLELSWPVSVADVAAQALMEGSALQPRRMCQGQKPPRVPNPTFLVADLEIDPLLWGTNPALVRQILRGFEACVHRAIEAEGGYLYRKRAGADEGIRAAFEEPHQACLSACALQEALQRHVWPEGAPRVLARVGIHQGPAECAEDGYFSPATRLAVHLMQAARPGQVLLTPTVVPCLRDGALSPVPLGLYRLKELALVLPLFRLWGEGLPGATRVESEAISITNEEGVVALALAMGLVLTEGQISKKSQCEVSH